MNDIIGTAGTGTTADEALEAYTAFRHSMDELTPLNKTQAERIDKTITTSARCRDGFLFTVTDPTVENKDPAAYIVAFGGEGRAGSIAHRSLYSTERTIPVERVTQAWPPSTPWPPPTRTPIPTFSPYKRPRYGSTDETSRHCKGLPAPYGTIRGTEWSRTYSTPPRPGSHPAGSSEKSSDPSEG